MKYRYEKSSHSAIHGEMYEVRLPALLFLRCKRNKRISRFQLATNVKGTDAMDDIVLKYEILEKPQKWYTCFLQLKSKDNRHLVDSNITNKSKHFPVKDKFVKSFFAIKELMDKPERSELFNGSFENFQFCLYTSAKAYGDLSGRKEENCLSELCILLNSHSEHSAIIGFKKDRDSAIFNEFKQKEHEFIEHFKLFTGQPTAKDLIKLIKEELIALINEEFETYSLDVNKHIDRLYEVYEQIFISWWEEPESSEIIDETSDLDEQAIKKVMTENVNNMCHLEQQSCSFLITFKDLTPFESVPNDSVSLYHVIVSAASLKLSCTKLLQCLKPHTCIFMSLECLWREQKSVLEVWGSGEKDWLVIQSDGLQECKELSQKLCFLLENSRNKKIAFVSPHSDNLFSNLRTKLGDARCEEISDECNFSQLSDEIVGKLMDMSLIFQGKQVCLRSLVGMNRSSFQNIILDDQLIDCFLYHKSYPIARSLSEDAAYFIPRTLKHFYISQEILFNPNLEGIVAISGVTDPEFKTIIPAGKRYCHISEKALHQYKYVLLDSDDCINQWRYMCNTAKKAHWIHREQDNLFVLRDSYGSLSDIRQHVIPRQHYVVESSLDVPQRCALLCGNSGIGKSALIAHLAKQTKEKDPSLWVICVSLNEHRNILEKTHFKDATQFLAYVLSVETSLFKMSLLRHSLQETGNAVVLLDGFDEIVGFSDLDSTCFTLITHLLQTKMKKLWVSSRSNMVEKLESVMSTIAIELHEFSNKDQREFFRQFLHTTNEFHSKPVAELESIESTFCELLDSFNKQVRYFIGIPLHTMMLSEIVVNNAMSSELSQIPSNVNLVFLLKVFIDRKFDMYLKKLLPDTNLHVDIRKQMKSVFDQKHMFASLVFLHFHVLFTEKLYRGDEIVATANAFMDEILKGEVNAGIVVQVLNGQFSFIHHCFAEYMAAKYFIDYFEENRKFLIEHLFSSHLGSIFYTFNLILADQYILHEAVLNHDEDLVKKLLQETGVCVNSKDHGGRTVLHLAACLNSDPNTSCKFDAIFPEPWYKQQFEFVRSKYIQNRHTEMLNILLQHVQVSNTIDSTDSLFGWTPCQYAIHARNWDAAEMLLSYNANSDILTFPPDLNNEFYLWSSIIEQGYAALMKLILKKGLYDGDSASNQLVLTRSLMKGHLKLVQVLVRSSEDILVPTRNLLHSGESSIHPNRNLLQHASMFGHNEILVHLISVLDNEIGEVERINAINERDSQGLTAMSGAAVFGNLSTVELLLTYGGSRALLEEDFERIATETARNGSIDVFKMVFHDIAERDLPVMYFQELLHIATSFSHKHVVQEIVDGLAPRGTEFVKQCIDFVGKFGESTLIMAALSRNPDILELLIKLRESELLDERVLHDVISSYKVPVIKRIIESVGNNPQSIKNMINHRNSEGLTGMHCACHVGGRMNYSCLDQADIVRYLISLGGDISVVDINGCTPLHYAVMFGNISACKVLIESLGENKEAVLEYISIKNKLGQTAKDYITKEILSVDIQQIIGNWLTEILATCMSN